MSPDDRAKLPAPPCCVRCAHLETWRRNGIERHHCLRGHPLQVGCTWQAPRTLTEEEKRDADRP